MRIFLTTSLIITCMLLALQQGMAQHLVDGFSQGKGKFAVALSHTRENFDEFYLGDKKTSITIRGLDKIITQSENLYAAYGLTDRIDIVVNIPYISSKSRQMVENKEVSEKNLQNGALVLEWKAWQTDGNTGALSFTTALGLSTPLSNYRTNLIYSIGNQSSHINPSLLLQYKFANGLFINGQGGYSFRTNKVPDAALLAAKIGFAATRFYIDGWINNQTSTSGIDIGGPGFTPERFPETKVNTTNIGTSVYVRVVRSAGITLGGGTRLAGRNAGLPTWYTAGLVLIL
jgi:hypothetical protein